MKITGTIINYYFHCKRQCWLFANRINLEDNSEDVHIGKVMHELKHEGKPDTEISIGNVKIDKLTDTYLIEIKKSDTDIEAVKWQTLYYLKVLKDKGINRKGRIEFIEKNKQDKKIHFVELNDDNAREIEYKIAEIEELISSIAPPEAIKTKKCRKCAYYEYCFI
jgi:CRISPR-associated exonuclease Cas4